MKSKKGYKDVVDLMLKTRFDDCISEAALNRLNDDVFVRDTDESSFNRNRQLKEYIDY